MASKNLMYKVNGKPTAELINKFDEDDHIFYRFQNPHYKLTSHSKSWGMIYSSAREAMVNAEQDGLTREEAVLPGKSCMPTFKEILHWIDQFDDNDVLLIFNGSDTRVSGHDDEYVATYYNKVAVWSITDVAKYAYKNLWNENGAA